MRRRAAPDSVSLLLPHLPRGRRRSPLTVFAAASLTEVMHDIDRTMAGRPDMLPLRTSLSPVPRHLARQIEQGAPASVFISADERWADYLAHAGLLVPGTRHDLLTNSLVLVMPKDTVRPITIDTRLDLPGLLGSGGRLAVGDPAHVPAGIYAQQALTKLGLWPAVSERLARAEDVRGALLLVERGEAPAGIVYATDVAVSPGLAIAGSFPASSHDPITYPVAVVAGGDTGAGQALVDFLSNAQSREAFAKRGFGFP